jgi:hypothetical protein
MILETTLKTTIICRIMEIINYIQMTSPYKILRSLMYMYVLCTLVL